MLFVLQVFLIPKILKIPSFLEKKYANLVASRNVNLAIINGSSFSNCSSIVELNISTSFVGIGAPRPEISILKAQTCVHLRAGCWDTGVLIDYLFTLV